MAPAIFLSTPQSTRGRYVLSVHQPSSTTNIDNRRYTVLRSSMAESSVSQAAATTIIEMIAGGESMRVACQSVGVTRQSFLRLMDTDKSLADQYARAREDRADVYGEQVGEIANATLRGDHDPQAARVAVDALKWVAGRMAPKRWGDQTKVEHSGEVKHEVVTLNIPAPKIIGEE